MTRKRSLSHPDVLARLRAATVRAGSLRSWARLNGVSAAYVSDVLLDRRAPGPSILGPLGLVKSESRIVVYVEGPSDDS